MIKKISCFLLIFICSISFPLQAVESHSLVCATELQPTLETLKKLPEIEQLIDKILSEGPLTIQYNDRLSNKFEGYWDPYSRAILMTKRPQQSEADRIMTMLFEMHNALRTRDFERVDHLAYTRQIKMEQFIQESEWIEYENCLSTSRLLAQGIEKGIFPRQCTWLVHDHFEDHYRLMKQTGHADWYAKAYKRMQ